MNPNIKLIKNEKLIYRYSNVIGLFNIHYNIVSVTNLRVIMTYAYKPWWYYLFFNLKPNEISNNTIFTKYISSLKIKTKSVYTTTYTGPFQFIFSKKLCKTDSEHLVKSMKYLPKRYSFDDIIFNATFRGMFLASVITAVLWKIFNVSKKILLIQALVCILINLIYDISSYSPVKYLEIYTLDGVGDEDTTTTNNNNSKSHSNKYKRHNNCSLYCSNNNSYIIEGDIKELKFLRDKIATVIQEWAIQYELLTSDKLRDNNTSGDNKKLENNNNNNKNIKDKDLNNIEKGDVELKNIKKRRKIKLIKKGLNQNENDKNKNKINKKDKIKNIFKKHKQFNIESIDKEESININNKTSLFKTLFGLILNFIRIIIISYISAILLLSIIYHTTKHLEQMTI
ncbi:hypothetical protein BCR32DRAFT_290803 [Anaeromyces robustus]|uniref:Uncharacterized protein n=1 Tax=Anaeromyces robustus TaxID=1754192 RepID=A0A1Y1XIP4_9FUNG|nr:hypothetical protein BCR32DRAFT_290803 [Anaeromyces robustus]|eukprot:ORX85246.1 hypothetical protein BCR32DRAFT_290803 [Anaeromyces robustus]